jgi:hypothetical protein
MRLPLFPNHVVSVAWTTNGPRLVAVMFALASLVVLQKAVPRRSLRLEALAFFLFALGGLADETALSLTPLGLAYALMVDHDSPGWLRRSSLRTVPYAILVLTLVVAVPGDGGRCQLNKFQFNDMMLQHFWALMSSSCGPQRRCCLREIAATQW